MHFLQISSTGYICQLMWGRKQRCGRRKRAELETGLILGRARSIVGKAQSDGRWLQKRKGWGGRKRTGRGGDEWGGKEQWLIDIEKLRCCNCAGKGYQRKRIEMSAVMEWRPRPSFSVTAHWSLEQSGADKSPNLSWPEGLGWRTAEELKTFHEEHLHPLTSSQNSEMNLMDGTSGWRQSSTHTDWRLLWLPWTAWGTDSHLRWWQRQSSRSSASITTDALWAALQQIPPSCLYYALICRYMKKQSCPQAAALLPRPGSCVFTSPSDKQAQITGQECVAGVIGLRSNRTSVWSCRASWSGSEARRPSGAAALRQRRREAKRIRTL